MLEGVTLFQLSLGGVHLPRGKNINEAAQEGNAAAVRHFLRIDPENVEKKGYNGQILRVGEEASEFEGQMQVFDGR